MLMNFKTNLMNQDEYLLKMTEDIHQMIDEQALIKSYRIAQAALLLIYDMEDSSKDSYRIVEALKAFLKDFSENSELAFEEMIKNSRKSEKEKPDTGSGFPNSMNKCHNADHATYPLNIEKYHPHKGIKLFNKNSKESNKSPEEL